MQLVESQVCFDRCLVGAGLATGYSRFAARAF